MYITCSDDFLIAGKSLKSEHAEIVQKRLRQKVC